MHHTHADIFGVVMARVNIINLNLVQLPKTAWCACAFTLCETGREVCSYRYQHSG
jgi:hypothetical protein